MSLLTVFICAVPSFIPMLCILCGVSCTGAKAGSPPAAAPAGSELPFEPVEFTAEAPFTAVICDELGPPSETPGWRERHQTKSKAATRITFKATATIRARLGLLFIG